MKKYILISLVALVGVSCSGEGEARKPEGFIKVKINTEKLNKEAKEEVEKAIENTEKNIKQLEDDVEKSVKHVEEQVERVEDALNELDEEFKDN